MTKNCEICGKPIKRKEAKKSESTSWKKKVVLYRARKGPLSHRIVTPTSKIRELNLQPGDEIKITIEVINRAPETINHLEEAIWNYKKNFFKQNYGDLPNTE